VSQHDPLDDLVLERRFVADRLGYRELKKGDDILLAKRVLDVDVTEFEIRGLVQGTQDEPYTQVMVRSPEPDNIFSSSKCSCPVGTNCKHIAAVLLKILQIKEERKRRRPPSNEIQIGEYTPPVEVVSWLRSVVSASEIPEKDYDEYATQKLVYLLNVEPITDLHSGVTVKVASIRQLKTGAWGDESLISIHSINSNSFPKFILPADRLLVTNLHKLYGQVRYGIADYRIEGPSGGVLLTQLAETGRLFWTTAKGRPSLRLCEPRRAQPQWIKKSNGSQQFSFQVDSGGMTLALRPLLYLDVEANEIGEAATGLPTEVGVTMLHAPEITAEQAHYVFDSLITKFPSLPELAPTDHKPPEVRIADPVPVFKVSTVEASDIYSNKPRGPFTAGILEFKYGEASIRHSSTKDLARVVSGTDVFLYPRDKAREWELARRLDDFGWSTYWHGVKLPHNYGNAFLLDEERKTSNNVDPVVRFITHGAEVLRKEGWTVQIGLDVAKEILPEPEWDINVDETSDLDWFRIQLGANVNGERIDLAPVLARVLKMVNVRQLNLTDPPLHVRLDDGRILPLPIPRLKPLLQMLVDLYGEPSQWSEMEKLPKWRLLDLHSLASSSDQLRWSGNERLKEVASQLASFESIGELKEPTHFEGELRQYQRQGVAWLQFLGRFGFGGVLADDMGLGKTIQTIAHLLWDKQNKKSKLPSLLIAPTSTLPNWTAELARFAPELKVVLLHGSSRKKQFAELDDCDLAISTYNLLARDKDELLKHHFHLMVLDEAQNVKNAHTAAAFVSRQVKAEQKICLSGTPMENHLGELWSLFHIIMPGLLGEEEQFKKRFRTPIEKTNNKAAQQELNRRIKPFLLRRTKEQVAKELPPKTELLEMIEMDGTQRDLYETIRSAMDKRVRQALDQQGLGRSHIVILDALLKLRQVCCDPRLVKVDGAKDVKTSVKLSRLMELLTEMVMEGRRILLFSQFTSMLELIEIAIRQADIPFVKLTGETRDRATPVARFQNKEVPLFLISIKAGGTGLNLTAADTVIHYDPWWNPAVERQATDRAHRIGQLNPVFVYKMIVQGTVEEKIVELQKRKAELAEALLDPEAQKLEITREDLEWIFS
jgi:superfamily II DNA or RNA helicase